MSKSEAEFTCVACEETFKKVWSDAKALADKEALFPETPIEDCETVCEACFNAMKHAGLF